MTAYWAMESAATAFWADDSWKVRLKFGAGSGGVAVASLAKEMLVPAQPISPASFSRTTILLPRKSLTDAAKHPVEALTRLA